MKNTTLLLAAAALLLAGEVKADLVYDNGLINGTINAISISSGYSESDSFIVSSATTLTEVQAGLWGGGGTPAELDWSIGTSPFGSDVSSATDAALISTPAGFSGITPLFESTFSVTGTVAPGEYWLTLMNAIPVSVGWDVTNGPSTAYEISTDNRLPGSQSFQVYGTPEPSTLVLAALGAAGLFLAARRRRV
jgi:hypothetical protein